MLRALGPDNRFRPRPIFKPLAAHVGRPRPLIKIDETNKLAALGDQARVKRGNRSWTPPGVVVPQSYVRLAGMSLGSAPGLPQGPTGVFVADYPWISSVLAGGLVGFFTQGSRGTQVTHGIVAAIITRAVVSMRVDS